MTKLLLGLDGFLYLNYDVLGFGKDKKHNDILVAVIKKTKELESPSILARFSWKGLTEIPNRLLDQEGFQAGTQKTAALQEVKPLASVSELTQFLRMIN